MTTPCCSPLDTHRISHWIKAHVAPPSQPQPKPQQQQPQQQQQQPQQQQQQAGDDGSEKGDKSAALNMASLFPLSTLPLPSRPQHAHPPASKPGSHTARHASPKAAGLLLPALPNINNIVGDASKSPHGASAAAPAAAAATSANNKAVPLSLSHLEHVYFKDEVVSLRSQLAAAADDSKQLHMQVVALSSQLQNTRSIAQQLRANYTVSLEAHNALKAQHDALLANHEQEANNIAQLTRQIDEQKNDYQHLQSEHHNIKLQNDSLTSDNYLLKSSLQQSYKKLEDLQRNYDALHDKLSAAEAEGYELKRDVVVQREQLLALENEKHELVQQASVLRAEKKTETSSAIIQAQYNEAEKQNKLMHSALQQLQRLYDTQCALLEEYQVREKMKWNRHAEIFHEYQNDDDDDELDDNADEQPVIEEGNEEHDATAATSNTNNTTTPNHHSTSSAPLSITIEESSNNIITPSAQSSNSPTTSSSSSSSSQPVVRQSRKLIHLASSSSPTSSAPPPRARHSRSLSRGDMLADKSQRAARRLPSAPPHLPPTPKTHHRSFVHMSGKLERCLNDTLKQNDILQSQNFQLNIMLKTITLREHQLQERYDALEAETKFLRNTLSKHEQQIDASESSHEKLRKQIKKCESDCEEMRIVCESRGDDIQRLQIELKDARAHLSLCNKQYEEMQDKLQHEIVALNDQIQYEMSSHHSAQFKLNKITADFTTLQASTSQLTSDKERLSNMISQLQMENQELLLRTITCESDAKKVRIMEERVNDTEMKLRNSEESLRRYKSELETMQSSFQTLSDQFTKSADEYKRLQIKFTAVNADNQRLMSKLQNAESSVESLEQTKHSTSGQAKELARELHELQRRCDHLEKEAVEAKKTHDARLSHYRNARKENALSKQRISTLKKQNESLQAALNKEFTKNRHLLSENIRMRNGAPPLDDNMIFQLQQSALTQSSHTLSTQSSAQTLQSTQSLEDLNSHTSVSDTDKSSNSGNLSLSSSQTQLTDNLSSEDLLKKQEEMKAEQLLRSRRHKVKHVAITSRRHPDGNSSTHSSTSSLTHSRSAAELQHDDESHKKGKHHVNFSTSSPSKHSATPSLDLEKQAAITIELDKEKHVDKQHDGDGDALPDGEHAHDDHDSKVDPAHKKHHKHHHSQHVARTHHAHTTKHQPHHSESALSSHATASDARKHDSPLSTAHDDPHSDAFAINITPSSPAAPVDAPSASNHDASQELLSRVSELELLLSEQQQAAKQQEAAQQQQQQEHAAQLKRAEQQAQLALRQQDKDAKAKISELNAQLEAAALLQKASAAHLSELEKRATEYEKVNDELRARMQLYDARLTEFEARWQNELKKNKNMQLDLDKSELLAQRLKEELREETNKAEKATVFNTQYQQTIKDLKKEIHKLMGGKPSQTPVV